MSKFEEFKREFILKYSERDKDEKEAIYEFDMAVMDRQNPQYPWNGRMVENLDEENHDSYGNEDSVLKRVVYFGDFDLFVQFYGRRESYNGSEWYSMKEVVAKTKEISYYEEINNTENY